MKETVTKLQADDAEHKREPYPWLSDAELEEIISEWAEPELPLSPETVAAILALGLAADAPPTARAA